MPIDLSCMNLQISRIDKDPKEKKGGIVRFSPENVGVKCFGYSPSVQL